LGKIGKEMVGSGEKVMRCQAHMCETPDDITRTRKIHGEKFETMGEMYDYYGLMHERSILAHCIWLTEKDMEILVKTKAGVAHNPNSNTCLRDGECPVRELLRKGVKVGLGTDCSAGYSTFILDAMRQASNVSRHRVIHTGDKSLRLGFEEIVFLGSLGSAQVLDLDSKVGNFLPGKCFDALVVDVGLEDNINISGWEEDDLALVKKFVFLGDDRAIRKVYVNGKVVAGKDLREKGV
jgi:guanine deaminase